MSIKQKRGRTRCVCNKREISLLFRVNITLFHFIFLFQLLFWLVPNVFTGYLTVSLSELLCGAADGSLIISVLSGLDGPNNHCALLGMAGARPWPPHLLTGPSHTLFSGGGFSGSPLTDTLSSLR